MQIRLSQKEVCELLQAALSPERLKPGMEVVGFGTFPEDKTHPYGVELRQRAQAPKLPTFRGEEKE